MKKILIIISAVLLMFSFSGCKAPKEDIAPEEMLEIPAESPVEPMEVPSEEPLDTIVVE